MTQEELIRLCEEKVSKKRFKHILAVRDQAVLLGKRYGEVEEKCITAALLHDITKEMKFEEQLKLILDSDFEVNDVILHSTPLYHAFTGAIYAKNRLHIEDKDILNAVAYHTIGRAGMSRLEKIIFVADAISEDRKYKGVEDYRKLAFEDLERCVLEMFRDNIRRLVKEGCLIPNNTIEGYNSLSILLDGRKK